LTTYGWQKRQRQPATVRASLTPTYTEPVYDEKGYIIDNASVLKLMMGEAVGDQPDLREFGSDTDSELEELLLTAPTIPRTVPSSEVRLHSRLRNFTRSKHIVR
jgi:hypothetical protein